MNSNSPLVKHLVLVGGGHSHLAVLKRLGMRPVAGLGVTLISRDILTPYSGSMPAYLSGQYQFADMHIDLRPLAQFAGARIIQAEVRDLDLDKREIILPERPPIQFDVLSLNTGSAPDASLIRGAEQYGIAVKPIDRFLERWQTLREQALERIVNGGQPFHLLIVGGGPASVELALSTLHRLQQDSAGKAAGGFDITLVSADETLLPGHNRRVQAFAAAELARRGIKVLLQHQAVEFQESAVLFSDGESLATDAIIYATGASLPGWPASSGLARSRDGFLEVNHRLQSTSHPFVFVAGDAATIADQPRPKSGVYAVRQGKVLAHNLVRYATGRSLRSYRPQKQALALMYLADGRAIASRGWLFMQGRLLWLLKHRIDSRFVKKYTQLPQMETPLLLAPGLVSRQEERQLREHAMRCAGCGGKVASGILEEVLQLMPGVEAAGPQEFEDATQIPLPDGRVLLQSVDYLRAFVNDPWLFARIATNHCLSDIYAMGAEPHSALAIVGLPHANRKYSRAQLLELMRGARQALDTDQCRLLGGHSAESEALYFGLCVNGFSAGNALLRKSGMQAGEALILTAALGTGTLLAADMRHQAKHEWMQNAFRQMLLSNRQAARVFVDYGASACTDITGFGLAGHLAEMLGQTTRVSLEMAAIPILDGALDCLERGITSSLQYDNSLIDRLIHDRREAIPDDSGSILFDPQTAGGLLASVPAARAETCVAALREAGYQSACRIGTVSSTDNKAPAIDLR